MSVNLTDFCFPYQTMLTNTFLSLQQNDGHNEVEANMKIELFYDFLHAALS
jgi:hypothetical protein